MGDEMIRAGICTGTSGTGWWNAMKTGSNFEAQFVPSPLDVSCTVGFNWSTATGARIEKRSMLCGESPESVSANSSITYVSDQPFTAPVLIMPSTSQLTGFDLSTPLMPDWNQPLLAQVDQACYPTMYQEDHTSVKPYFANQNHMGGDNTALNHPNQNNQFISGQDVSSDSSLPMPFEFPSTILRSLLESSNRPPELPFNHIHPIGFPSNEGFDPSNVNSSHFDKTSTIRQPLQFSNETPFWTTANNMSNNYDLRTSMTGHDNQALKTKQEGSGGGSSSLIKRKTESQSGFKKPRMESTPPPMPAFKVRKEKVGDRISALQQLVSPFGKTDTASVLHETIDYIKFLHDQVEVLSAPYLKNGHQMQHIKNMERIKESNEGTKRDLISRGLCLVPISSTFAVASEVPVEIWAPAFAASFR